MKTTLSDWLQEQNTQASFYRGHIGLWWVDGEQFYINSHEVEDGKGFGSSIHSVTNHKKTWRTTVLTHRPDLREFSYTYLPRGRIYFDKAANSFCVVGTPGPLELPKFLAALEGVFDIQTNLVVSQAAEDHYTGEMGPDIATALATIAIWK